MNIRMLNHMYTLKTGGRSDGGGQADYSRPLHTHTHTHTWPEATCICARSRTMCAHLVVRDRVYSRDDQMESIEFDRKHDREHRTHHVFVCVCVCPSPGALISGDGNISGIRSC